MASRALVNVGQHETRSDDYLARNLPTFDKDAPVIIDPPFWGLFQKPGIIGAVALGSVRIVPFLQ